ncbi:hypothetical protein K505DRAFT_325558 [Melanomma pulvis-pyrius CBS 109.77]|uniref:Zn(2)-C6 fungal-type domain-containing protein n=1 Tax=Melanomma pulvis-pyrius CBS 109.77 TaxID=1314802 RepID=A0A6A6XAB2_9PLEO|nr:hypothetical protein K505DRAFT_325558 [Melanomma pulvis-pyrius CBS 109.77]
METTPQPQPSTEWVHVTGNPRETATPPDTSQNEQKSPSAKRRKEDRERTRVSRACDRCKKKKTRCTGKCPCTLCLRIGLSCEFTASYTRGRLPSVVVDETAITTNTRPRILMPTDSSPIKSSTPPFPFQKPLPSPIHDHPNADVFSRVDRLPVPNEDAARDPATRSSPEPTQTDQQGHYVGTSSGVSLILRIQKRLHQSSALSHDSSIFTFGDAPLPEVDQTFFVLPPRADAERLVKCYFEFAASTHRYLHRPSIEGILNEFYETQGNMHNKEDGQAKTALLLSVFAQSTAHMAPGSTTQPDSARFFFAAERLLAKERGAMRLTSVQARLGQCFYLLAQSRINHCWSLFGTTAHLALAIGLHRGRRGDSSATIDYVELESRRRLFWCAYTLDKYLAAALGRPQTFRDEDIDQELPTVVNDDDLLPHSINPAPLKSHTIMMAPVEHAKISRIVSRVLRDIYCIRPPSMSLRIEFAAKYSKDLGEWRANLARFLDADVIDSSLLVPIYQRQRNVLNLAYYHSILLIQRPFLLTNFANLANINKNSDQTTNIDTSQNIEDCLDAAMRIVGIVDDMFKRGGMFSAFWFSQYYGFCAVVVLYIARIQQHLLTPGQCKGYFDAGQKCQAQLSTISVTDCLSKRYCLVLEELRLEAARQTRPTTTSPSANMDGLSETGLQNVSTSTGLSIPASTPQNDASAYSAQFYGGNIPPTPESAMFNTSFMQTSSLMADLTSWGQFDSLVTAGIGVLDGGFQSDAGLGFGMGR